MEELKVIVNPQLGTIVFNNEELKEHLTGQMKVYKELPVNAENRTERKKDVATLRKYRKAVEDKRKEIKTLWMKPYEEFEGKVRELTTLIDEPITLISDQVKELESRERMEKKATIQKYFEEAAAEYLDWLVLDQIYDEKWLNASVSMKTVNTEMTQKLSDIRSNLAALSLSVSDVKEEAIERYKADLNFTSALAYINQYEAQRARIQKAEEENRKREQEAQLERERQRIRDEERQRIRDEEKIRQQAKAEVAQEIKAPITDEVVSNAKVSAVYAVSAPQELLAELEMAMDSLGITWERKEL